ncbi:hypothetical protein NDU88_007991 [Pleurodeles waltl]|uniref:Uncharacterized protein n=1 Tax=Pleurodeles waltl TaxID=8319 RepID=A0AAV7QT94_PLEWA|nr:hypothetical protein NDU88_007991 [Pleurodeles waltl]
MAAAAPLPARHVAARAAWTQPGAEALPIVTKELRESKQEGGSRRHTQPVLSPIGSENNRLHHWFNREAAHHWLKLSQKPEASVN